MERDRIVQLARLLARRPDVYRELTFCKDPADKRAKLLDPEFRRRFNESYDPVMFEATAEALPTIR